MTGERATDRLAALLRQTGAVPRLRAERIVPSSIYDPVYRIGVIGMAFVVCGKPQIDGARRLNGYHLKLLQFVAVRPSVLPRLLLWVEADKSRNEMTLEQWLGFPRGFAADTLHEGIVSYLVASGQLLSLKNDLLAPAPFPGATFMGEVTAKITSTATFGEERRVLDALRSIRFTQRMLAP